MSWFELQESKVLGVQLVDCDGSVCIPGGSIVFAADGETTLDRRVTYSFDEPVPPMGLALSAGGSIFLKELDPHGCSLRRLVIHLKGCIYLCVHLQGRWLAKCVSDDGTIPSNLNRHGPRRRTFGALHIAKANDQDGVDWQKTRVPVVVFLDSCAGNQVAQLNLQGEFRHCSGMCWSIVGLQGFHLVTNKWTFFRKEGDRQPFVVRDRVTGRTTLYRLNSGEIEMAELNGEFNPVDRDDRLDI